MKADISDAPERVNRRHHKPNVFYTVICLMTGSLVMIGALQLISRAPSLDSAYKRTASSTENKGGFTRASEMPPSQDPSSSWLRASSQVPAPDNTTRQTVFNDQNFAPKGADNVVTFPVSSNSPPLDEPRKTTKITIVRQSPSMKERACWPFRWGSIELRSCRFSVGLKHRD